MKTVYAFVLMLLFAFSTSVYADVTSLSTDQLMQNRFTATPMQLLDVRSEKEFSEGHIKGAKNIAYDQLSEHLHTLDKQAPLVVYCRSGRRASIALALLEEHGFTQLYHLEGDILGWQSKKLPLITDQRALSN